jgi:hypothetical protein
MTAPLPKWIQKRYAVLWNKHKDKELSYEDIKSSLEDKSGLNVFLSELRKAGWLEVKLSPEDNRKRVYKLKEPNKAMKEIAL